MLGRARFDFNFLAFSIHPIYPPRNLTTVTKMSKSAFNLVFALFDFSSLNSGTKPVC